MTVCAYLRCITRASIVEHCHEKAHGDEKHTSCSSAMLYDPESQDRLTIKAGSRANDMAFLSL